MTEPRDCQHGRLARSCEICELEAELAIAEDLREKMASILTRSVNAIRGEPETLHLHSWHDLPELIDKLLAELEALQNQEPVAWLYTSLVDGIKRVSISKPLPHIGTNQVPLYAAAGAKERT